MANKKVPLYRLKLIGFVGGWFMGHDYMRGVSRNTAKTLVEKLPEVGWEQPLYKVREGLVIHQLALQNVSSTFVLACPSAKVEAWPRLFPYDFTFKD